MPLAALKGDPLFPRRGEETDATATATSTDNAEREREICRRSVQHAVPFLFAAALAQQPFRPPLCARVHQMTESRGGLRTFTFTFHTSPSHVNQSTPKILAIRPASSFQASNILSGHNRRGAVDKEWLVRCRMALKEGRSKCRCGT